MDTHEKAISTVDASLFCSAELQDEELFRRIAGRFKILLCIDSRMLRQCIGYVLKRALKDSVVCYASEADLAFMGKPDVVLMEVCAASMSKPLHQLLKALPETFAQVPVVALSDVHDVGAARAAVRAGFRGFLSPSSDLDTAVAAIRLAVAGQVYIPADILGLWADGQPEPVTVSAPVADDYVHFDEADEPEPAGVSLDGSFTDRELEVIDRLKLGKPNKIIAYELDITESTVKVHIRNIMRKLSATNRTQVAFLTREIFRAGSDSKATTFCNGFVEHRLAERAKPVQ